MNSFGQAVFHAARIRAMRWLAPQRLFHRLSALEWYREALQQWAEPQLRVAGEHLLEVGCATGYLTHHAYARGLKPCGVDLSTRMIKTARTCYPGLDFRVADAGALPFDAEYFDRLMSASLINIVPQPQEVLAEMWRVCRPGGTVSLLFPRFGYSDDDLRETVRARGLSGFSEAAITAWHRMAPKLDVDELAESVRRVGFVQLGQERFLDGMLVSVSGRKPARA